MFFTHVCASVTFNEFSKELGINFTHNDGRTGQYHMTETSGSGIAWIDFNNDDKLDLLIINGIDGKHKLFENTGEKFIDVSKQKLPIPTSNRGMGICSADINQDGWVDFLITSYGTDILYINQNGEKFVGQKLEPNQPLNRWSTSCAFADLDNDGDLDLYVARYAEFKLNGNKTCQNRQAKGCCNPTDYLGSRDGLYLNDGHASFTDTSKVRGIHTGTKDRGFGVIISDYDQDGDNDIYVANDGSHNRLYANNGKGYFIDQGLMSGVAINQDGKSEASMGLAIADINHDGYQDIIASHFSLETNTLYQNYGNSMFADMTQAYGLNQSSFIKMGWGISFSDVNNDSYDDLIVANGHLHDFIKKIDSRQTYQQSNQLFLNNKGRKFGLQTHENSFVAAKDKASRGLAMGDFNNDGKVDVAINNINDEVDVFINKDENKNNWLAIKLVGNKVNRSAIGAIVIVKSGNLVQRKEVVSGGSFMSQADFRLIFGLTNHSGTVEVNITWPNGNKKKINIDKLNRYHTIQY